MTRIFCLAFSPDGKKLATVMRSRPVRSLFARRRKTGDCKPRRNRQAVGRGDRPGVALSIKGHTDFVVFVAFSDDDKILTSAGRDQTIRFWRAATAEEVMARDIK